jgi:hypothetical protein
VAGGPRDTAPDGDTSDALVGAVEAGAEDETDAGSATDEPTKPKSVLPRPGRWSVDTTNVRFRCGGRTVSMPSRKGEIGLIRLNSSAGGFTIADPDSPEVAKMKPHKSKQNTYVGTSSYAEGGDTIRFKWTLKVANPKKITGKLNGKAKLNGQNCTITENYKATFKGK